VTKLGSLIAIVSFFCSNWAAIAQTNRFEPADWPEQPPEFVSATFARAGITVRDIDESLEFFRDVLGMRVIVDRRAMYDPRLPAFSGLAENQTIRLTILQPVVSGASELNMGYIALSEISDAKGDRVQPLEPAKTTGSEPGSIMLQFLVDDVRSIHSGVSQLGYEIISPPVEREDGTRSELLVRDFNGIRYWITDRYTRTLFLDRTEE